MIIAASIALASALLSDLVPSEQDVIPAPAIDSSAAVESALVEVEEKVEPKVEAKVEPKVEEKKVEVEAKPEVEKVAAKVEPKVEAPRESLEFAANDDRKANGKQVAPRTVKITSERTDYDRKEGVVMFDRNVFVDDPEYKLHSDQLYVFLDGTNDLKRVVAIGNVAITNELRSGRCAKATYTKATSKVVMYGDGNEVMAVLRDDGKRKSEVVGKKITFWTDSEQVEVEGSTITLDGGSMGGKNAAKKLLGK